MTLRYVATGCAILLAWFVSCQPASQDEGMRSDLRIDSGISITQRSENKATAVYSINGCTATAVSANTLVFAAHCLGDAGHDAKGNIALVNTRVCAQNYLIRGGSNCTNTVMVPLEWATQSALQYAYDVAVAVFKDKPFKTFMPIATQPINVGDPVLLVGYSSEYLNDTSEGSKRWGRNTISSKLSNITLVSTYRGNADGVAVSPGDSGGPLLKESCELAGVASRMTTDSSEKSSLHTNLTWEKNQAWLQSLSTEGAHICGMHGADPVLCSPAAQVRPMSFANKETFPCSEDPNAAPATPPSAQPGTTTEPALRLLANSTTDSIWIQVALDNAQGASPPRLCLVANPTTTSSTDDCLASPVDTTLQFKVGSRSVFAPANGASLAPPQNAASQAFGVLVMSSQGERLAVARIVRR